MADAQGPITSSPSTIPGGYDATSDADLGAWVKTSVSPPGGSEDLWRTEFPDTPPWQQT